MNKSLLLFVTSMGLLGTVASGASPWTLTETARDNGHRLAPVSAPSTETKSVSTLSIRCDEAALFQEIEGFGGALTEASGYVLSKLPAASRAKVLRSYYDPSEGIGYTLARTHINSCDFSLKSWSLAETPGDTELKHFSLDPMRQWTLPLIREAQAIAGKDRFRLVASPWSPPAWMKDNGSMLQGGRLLPQYRDTWARTFVRFVEALRDEEGVPVWALTVQNEPAAKQTWESCLYSPEEERDFVAQHLGPTLEKAGLGSIHLLGLDHNRDILEERAKAMLGDPKAAKYLWGMALHWYVSEDFAASSRVKAAFPDKKLLFTEGCMEGGAKPGSWAPGERYARNIIGDLRNHVSGWIDWNIALDLQGGPNHVGNFCDAPILVDTAKGEYLVQNSFHYIGHFSRFVRTGARRLASEGGSPTLQHVAFVNPDKSLVVVVLNVSDSPESFTLESASGKLTCTIPAHAIHTYRRAAH